MFFRGAERAQTHVWKLSMKSLEVRYVKKTKTFIFIRSLFLAELIGEVVECV